MSVYNDQRMGHADEADGIEEFDNPLPDWWIGLFWLSVCWGASYFLYFTVLGDGTQADWYDEEVAAAEKRWPDLVAKPTADRSPETLAAGGAVFKSTCMSCHGANLEGGIGPNLTDAEWIHGGDFESVVSTISDGVAAKGMPSWGPILGPKKIAAVASFILSKGGTAPAAEPAVASEEAEDVASASVAAAVEPPSGEAVFTANCVACHKADLTGGIGPNLVDEEWIHGGDLAQIRATIEAGVPDKGMVSWKGVLAPEQIEAVAQYVHEKSLH